MKQLLRNSLYAALGVVLGCAFLFPGTWVSAGLAWVFLLLLCLAVQSGRFSLRGVFLLGAACTAVGFYWLKDTMVFFGGFPNYLACIFFVIFCLFSALQFLLCGWLYQRLSRTFLQSFGLSLPLAWLVAEGVFPKMFPWALAHTQLLWTSFANLAEILSIEFLSALLFWWAWIAVSTFRSKTFLRSETCCGVLVLAAVLIWGNIRTAQLETEIAAAQELKVALIQGNLHAKQKRNVRYFDANIEEYRRLTDRAAAQGAEIVLWPESAAMFWTPEEVESVRGTPFDPYSGSTLPLLYGGLTMSPRSAEDVKKIVADTIGLVGPDFERRISHLRYNSALGIDADGKLEGLYHKRVLMPFGEYIPFGRKIPWLYTLSPYTGDFDPGNKLDPIEFHIQRGDESFTAAMMPLVCYEDLVARLGREGVERGAEIFVNLTNDAWYGDTAAPHQHNLLASWRSIETRRFLLRVTNTGLTSVVNPFGITTGSLPVFDKGFLLEEVRLLKIRTIYSRIADWPFWISVLGVLILALLKPIERDDETAK